MFILFCFFSLFLINKILACSEFADFDSIAQIVEENGAVSLVHDGHKFICDRNENGRRYWRCRKSFRFNCKARTVSKVMPNGSEMMKIRTGEHDHTERTKNRHKKSKLKIIKPKLPKLTPIPKVELNTQKNELSVESGASGTNGENPEKYSPSTVDDAENDIVDILD